MNALVSLWLLLPIFLLYLIDHDHSARTIHMWPWLFFSALALSAGSLWVARKRSLSAPLWLVGPASLLLLRAISIRPALNFGAYLHSLAQASTYLAIVLVVFNARAVRLTTIRRALIVPLTILVLGNLGGIFTHKNPFTFADVIGSGLGHRNWMSVFVALSLPWLLTSGRVPMRLLTTLSIYVVLANRTRSAWLMLVIYLLGLLLVWLTSRDHRAFRPLGRFVLSFVVALIALKAIPNRLKWAAPSPYLTSLSTMTSLKQSSGRDQIWRVLLEMAKEHPLRGVGSGNYLVRFYDYVAASGAKKEALGTVTSIAGMNDYLQEAAETGILGGAILLLAVLSGAILAFLRAHRRRWLLAIVALGPVALAADAMVDFPFQRAETVLLFFITVAILLRDLRARSVRLPRIALGPIALAASALLAFVSLRELTSNAFEIRYRRSQALEDLERSYRAWPWDQKSTNRSLVEEVLNRKGAIEAKMLAADQLKNWPNLTDSRLAMALVDEQQGNFTEALEYYRTIFAGSERCSDRAVFAFERMIKASKFPASLRSEAQQLHSCKAAPAASTFRTKANWNQAQSFLSEWRGDPLFSANWSGSFRPYVFHQDRPTPVFPAHLPVPVGVEMLSPRPLSDEEILVEGSYDGREDRFDLFLYDRAGTISKLTDAPDDNNGALCVLPRSRAISWHTKHSQQFARILPDGKLQPTGESSSPLEECIWRDERTVIGYAHQHGAYQLWQCTIDSKVTCHTRASLEKAVHVMHLFAAKGGAVGVVALTAGASFRRPFLLSSDGDRLLPASIGKRTFEGDVLDVHRDHLRIGLHSRYAVDATPTEAGIVHAFEQIGPDMFAIYSDAKVAKVLARRTETGWTPIALASTSSVDARADTSIPRANDSPAERRGTPLEIWIRTPADRQLQAFYFGPLDPTSVVMWWHGGPKENVSPRYSPYFQVLNELGFGVLAVNYPGSTGRGAAFEADFSPTAALDTFDGAFRFLQSSGVTKIVSWSVSTGEIFQKLILENGRAVSAIVDEGGARVDTLREAAHAGEVPYFNIGGSYDPLFDLDTVNDFSYSGGHALLRGRDFFHMVDAIGPFLSSVPPITSAQVGSAPRATLDPEDPLAFELAEDLLADCLKEHPVRLLRDADRSLRSADTARDLAGEVAESPSAPRFSIRFSTSETGPSASSVTLRAHPSANEVRAANRFIDALRTEGMVPQSASPNSRSLAPGLFERDEPAPPEGQGCRFAAEIFATADSEERRLLENRELASDGPYVHPRLRNLARILCPSVLEAMDCRK